MDLTDANCLNSQISLLQRLLIYSNKSLHYFDVIMGTVASQISSLRIVYSTVYSDADQRKKSKLCVIGLCAGNSPGTGEFPAHMASNAENVSIWWRHHGMSHFLSEYVVLHCGKWTILIFWSEAVVNFSTNSNSAWLWFFYWQKAYYRVISPWL